MAELADALDLGSSGATRTGSIPASRTNQQFNYHLSVVFYYYKDIFNSLDTIFANNIE